MASDAAVDALTLQVVAGLKGRRSVTFETYVEIVLDELSDLLREDSPAGAALRTRLDLVWVPGNATQARLVGRWEPRS